MSSHFGRLFSEDDFYMLSNNMVVQETTLNNNNLTNSKLNIKSNQISIWMRTMIANKLANNGEEWCKYFSHLNNGCYTNQYMILDFKLFTPHEDLKDNLLWVLEEMPGRTTYADVTLYIYFYNYSRLRDEGYWPSYNIAYFKETREVDNVQILEDEYGPFYNYNYTSRALIFKRDHVKIKNISDLRKLMRSNNYKTDEYSRCNCTPPYSAELAIASRGDLNPADGIYPFSRIGHRDHMAIDAKVTSYLLFKDKMSVQMISSPPYGDDLPPFQWSKADFNTTRHDGIPDLWNFPWYVLKNEDPEDTLHELKEKSKSFDLYLILLTSGACIIILIGMIFIVRWKYKHTREIEDKAATENAYNILVDNNYNTVN